MQLVPQVHKELLVQQVLKVRLEKLEVLVQLVLLAQQDHLLVLLLLQYPVLAAHQ